MGFIRESLEFPHLPIIILFGFLSFIVLGPMVRFLLWTPDVSTFGAIFSTFWVSLPSDPVALLPTLFLAVAVGIGHLALMDSIGFFFDRAAREVCCKLWGFLGWVSPGENRIKKLLAEIDRVEESRDELGLAIGVGGSKYTCFKRWLSGKEDETVYNWEFFISTLFRNAHAFLLLTMLLWLLTAWRFGVRTSFSSTWTKPVFSSFLLAFVGYLVVSVAWTFHKAAFKQLEQSLYEDFRGDDVG